MSRTSLAFPAWEDGLRIYRRQPGAILFGPGSPTKVTFRRGMFARGRTLEHVARALACGWSNEQVKRRTGVAWQTIQKVRAVLETEAGRPFLCECGKPATHRERCSIRDWWTGRKLKPHLRHFAAREDAGMLHPSAMARRIFAKGRLPKSAFPILKNWVNWTIRDRQMRPHSVRVSGKRTFRFYTEAQVALIEADIIASSPLWPESIRRGQIHQRRDPATGRMLARRKP